MKRPTSITVLAVINLIFAVMGLCGTLGGLVIFFLQPDPTMPNPALDAIHYSAFYRGWYILCIGLGTVACAVLAASGIGLWKLAAWGRKLAIAYSIYALLMGVAAQLVNVVYVYQPLLEQLEYGGREAAGGAVAGVVGGICGGCFGLLYPCILLFFLTRPHLAALFAAPEPDFQTMGDG